MLYSGVLVLPENRKSKDYHQVRAESDYKCFSLLFRSPGGTPLFDKENMETGTGLTPIITQALRRKFQVGHSLQILCGLCMCGLKVCPLCHHLYCSLSPQSALPRGLSPKAKNLNESFDQN